MQQLSNEKGNAFTVDNAQSDKNAAATQIGFFSRAMDRFRLDVKKYPHNLSQLVKSTDKGWDGPYMDNIANDPWGHSFEFVAPGKHNKDTFDVWSIGPDGQSGTADDIGNWER
jgi:general secretion pathway protein G